jgi:HK97 family phage portal protein
VAEQYPAGVLLDAWSKPFSQQMPTERPPTPAGAMLPMPYQPTTIIVEAGGGRVALTESDSAARTISYADIYATQPAVAWAVNKLYRNIATLPLKVYRHAPGNRTVNGKPAFPEEVIDPSNSLVSLLSKPAPGHGPVSLKEWVVLPYFVHGNSLIAKFRGNGDGTAPTELLPLDWRFLQAWARIGQPVLVWATVQTGQLKYILPSETVFTAWTSPAGANGAFLGTSPLQQLGTTIKIDEAAQRFAAASFKNAGRPSGAIILPPEVDVRRNPEITTTVRKQVETIYGGVDNAMRIAVLGGGATWVPWSAGTVEAQLVATRQWDYDEVAMVYDLYNDKGSTNIPETDARFFKTVARTHLVMIADRLQAQLVDPEPEWVDDRLFVKFDIAEHIIGDPLVFSDKMTAETLAGIRSVDEARVPLGLPPRGGVSDILLSDTYAGGGTGPGGAGGAPGPAGAPGPTEKDAEQEARVISAVRRV